MIAEKNEAERKGMREAQLKDAMIFCNLMARIENDVRYIFSIANFYLHILKLIFLELFHSWQDHRKL